MKLKLLLTLTLIAGNSLHAMQYFPETKTYAAEEAEAEHSHAHSMSLEGGSVDTHAEEDLLETTKLPVTLQGLIKQYTNDPDEIPYASTMKKACVDKVHARNIVSIIGAEQPKDQRIVTGSFIDNIARIWDPNTGTCLQELHGHTLCIPAVCALDDNRIATGSQDTTIRIWEQKTGKCLHTLTGHTGTVHTVMMINATQMISVAYGDTVIRVWNYQTGKLIHTIQSSSPIFTINSAIIDGEDILATYADGTAGTLNVNSGEVNLLENIHDAYMTQFAPNDQGVGAQSLFVFHKNGTFSRVSEDGVKTLILKEGDAHTQPIFYALYVPLYKKITTYSCDGTQKLWNLSSNTLIRSSKLSGLMCVGILRGITADKLLGITPSGNVLVTTNKQEDFHLTAKADGEICVLPSEPTSTLLGMRDNSMVKAIQQLSLQDYIALKNLHEKLASGPEAASSGSLALSTEEVQFFKKLPACIQACLASYFTELEALLKQ